ncbi:MAG: OsmC family peroxiredoxin [Chloroflexi bacterium]|nr:MAG: OsmC family peroxiredoxin [Chloroflexota bacterium]
MSEEKPTNLWKEINASWDGADGYTAENKAGGIVLMGKDKEGKPGIGPMEMLLAGLAGCTGMDIIEILKKKRQVPTDFKVKARGNQKIDTYPMLFTEFQVEYLLWGDNLKQKDVEQAIQLSEEKYCSVGGTLAKAAPIHSTYRILKAGEKAD